MPVISTRIINSSQNNSSSRTLPSSRKLALEGVGAHSRPTGLHVQAALRSCPHQLCRGRPDDTSNSILPTVSPERSEFQQPIAAMSMPYRLPPECFPPQKILLGKQMKISNTRKTRQSFICLPSYKAPQQKNKTVKQFFFRTQCKQRQYLEPPSWAESP